MRSGSDTTLRADAWARDTGGRLRKRLEHTCPFTSVPCGWTRLPCRGAGPPRTAGAAPRRPSLLPFSSDTRLSGSGSFLWERRAWRAEVSPRASGVGQSCYASAGLLSPPLRFCLPEQGGRAGKCALLRFPGSTSLIGLGRLCGRSRSKKVGKASICCSVARSRSPLFRPRGPQPARLLRPRDAPHKKAGVGGHVPLQGLVPTQGSNPRLLPWQAESLPRGHLEAPSEDAELGLLRGPRVTSVPAVRKLLGLHYRGKGGLPCRLPCGSNTGTAPGC